MSEAQKRGEHTASQPSIPNLREPNGYLSAIRRLPFAVNVSPWALRVKVTTASRFGSTAKDPNRPSIHIRPRVLHQSLSLVRAVLRLV